MITLNFEDAISELVVDPRYTVNKLNCEWAATHFAYDKENLSYIWVYQLYNYRYLWITNLILEEEL